MRRLFYILCGVVVFATLFACGGGPDAARQQREPKKPTPSSADPVATNSPQPSPKSTPSNASPTIHKMKESVHVGYTTYSLWSARWSNRLSKNEYLDQKPNASYLFLELTVRNDDTKARMVPPFKLLDENNAEYEASSKAWAVEGSIGSLESLNPSVSKQGFVVFDVPRNHKYKLKISGGFWSTEDALIEVVVLDAAEEQRKAIAKQAEATREAEKRNAILEEQRRVAEEATKKVIEEAKWRTWASSDGKFSVEAKFGKFLDGVVTLVKQDGSAVNVPIDKLSSDDQDFIRKRKWLTK